MKILNTQYHLSQNKVQPNFKRINPTLEKHVTTVLKTPANKDIFFKFAGVIGLTSIINFTTSLKENSSENTAKLDVIDKFWTNKSNQYFLDTTTTDDYLDLTSKSNTQETEIWTQALTSSKQTQEIEPTSINETTKGFFISNETNETFMDVSANKNLSSILNQLAGINNADKEVKKSILEIINDKLISLVKQAEKLQNEEETSAIFTKLANIARNFTFTKILELKKNQKEEKEQQPELVAEEIVEPPKPTDEGEKLPPRVKVIGKIDLTSAAEKPRRGRGRPRVENPITETEDLKPIIPTETNKAFVEIFLGKFGKKPPIKPEVYSEKIDLIKQIYETYSASKPMVRNRLLSRFKQENLLGLLALYEKLTGGDFSKIGFINFADLESLKNKNDASLTENDYEKLAITKDSVYKFFNISPEEEKVCVTFVKGVSYKDRLKFLADFHKIAFNIPEDNILKSKVSETGDVSVEDIKTELAQKLADDSENYANIADFLGLDTSDIELEIEKGNRDEALEVANEHIEKIPSYQLEELMKILNNATFEGFIDGVHARMRFIERIVFKNKKLIGLKSYDVKIATNNEIKTLKSKIENMAYIDMYNYSATKNEDRLKNKYSPKVIIDDVTIALNNNARIHTIY